ncbi:hypothetical protein ACVWZR_001644 [Bradyrhizobium sp. i1.3.1]
MTGRVAFLEIIRVDVSGMQEAEMRRVDIAFEALEPVGFALEDGDGQILLRNEQRFVHRHRRRLGPRAHVNPYEARALANPVAFCADLFLEILRRGDVRHFEAAAVNVELPAVIDATDTVLLVTAEEQRGTTVRTLMIQHANPARAVTEGNELLTEQHQAHWIAVD